MKSDTLTTHDETESATFGACRYCGQVIDTAVENCNCPGARHEEKIAELTEEARERIDQLFGSDAEALGFKPLPDNGSLELLNNVAALIAKRVIYAASVQIRGNCKAKLNMTTKGKIKVARSEARSYELEAGE